jgi:peptide/nickel transport system ATP-binding protein
VQHVADHDIAEETKGRPPLLEIEGASVRYPVRRGTLFKKSHIHAVDDVYLRLEKGETLGLVGESGSGKSTLAKAVVQVEELSDGDIRFEGTSLRSLRSKELTQRRRRFQMVFQDPAASLNPRHTVERIIREPLDLHGIGTSEQRAARVTELLGLVGLDQSSSSRFPHMLSGGQQQRVAIARALSLDPALVVCDEPLSALDVSVQAQIVNLLMDLQQRLSIAYLFIAHDLSVVRYISDRVAVMYLGQVVETAPSEQLYKQPLHPYTRALLSAIPVPNPRIERQRKRLLLGGDPPDPANPPSGCRFHTRCPWAQPRCAVEVPFHRPGPGGASVACHYFEEIERSTDLHESPREASLDKELTPGWIGSALDRHPDRV